MWRVSPLAGIGVTHLAGYMAVASCTLMLARHGVGLLPTGHEQ